MATNVTASALLDVQARLNEMFADGQETPSRFPYSDPVSTAKAMLRETRASTTPVLKGNGDNTVVVGYRVYWPQLGSTTLDVNSTTAPTLACDLSEGTGPTTSSKTYNHNMWLQKVVELDDDLFGNVFDFVTLAADRLAAARLAIIKGLNTKAINFFDSNKTAVNNDSSLPTGITFGSSLFTVASGVDMQEPDTLTDLDAIAQNNDMLDYYYLNGRYNFYNSVINSQYRAANDNERDHGRYGAYDMYFDIRDLDNTISGSNTFIISRGSYVLWDMVSRGAQPVQVKDNSWEYSIDDPQLLIWDNGLLRPLRYNVYYQKVCNGTNESAMRRTFTHRWEVTLVGGMHVAPAAEDNHTGILRFKQGS